MFPTATFAGDQLRMRILASMSDAPQENTLPAEVGDSADTPTRLPCSLASLAIPLHAPLEIQAATNDRAPERNTEMTCTLDAPASPHTPPPANPYTIMIAPLQALANFFKSFMSRDTEVVTSLATAYQVQLQDSPKQYAAECGVLTAACSRRVGLTPADALVSLQTSSVHSATRLGVAYQVQLEEPSKPNEPEPRYECCVPVAACRGCGTVEAFSVDASLPTAASSALAELQNDSVEECGGENGECWARTGSDGGHSAQLEESTAANPYLVIFSESKPTVPSDSFMV